ncbi:hypothetical protein U0070_010204 [Myodes glareolus]|uniref:Cyclin-dependent kinases regulatory subunit n=1 Tax=Myodes glareolus TaxID=447135 RepID=A0AAW0IA06_MYOGA
MGFIIVQEGEHPNRLDPKNPVYAEETSPSVIVNGFSERLQASHIQKIRPHSENLVGSHARSVTVHLALPISHILISAADHLLQPPFPNLPPSLMDPTFLLLLTSFPAPTPDSLLSHSPKLQQSLSGNPQATSGREAGMVWNHVHSQCALLLATIPDLRSAALGLAPSGRAFMLLKQIYYLEKYDDEEFENWHVMLPKDIAKLLPKTHLMSEYEWRKLGLTGVISSICRCEGPHPLAPLQDGVGIRFHRQVNKVMHTCLVTLHCCVPAYSRGIIWDYGQRTNPRVTCPKQGLFPI